MEQKKTFTLRNQVDPYGIQWYLYVHTATYDDWWIICKYNVTSWHDD